jgi:hypothetical protein
LTEVHVLDAAASALLSPAPSPTAAAYAYAADVANEAGESFDGENVVLAWVMLSLPAVGRWSGKVSEMHDAIVSASDGFDEGALEEARDYNTRARKLWSKCIAARRGAKR